MNYQEILKDLPPCCLRICFLCTTFTTHEELEKYYKKKKYSVKKYKVGTRLVRGYWTNSLYSILKGTTWDVVVCQEKLPEAGMKIVQTITKNYVIGFEE